MAHIKVKTGVQPKALIIMAAIANVVQDLQEPVAVVITSGTDGAHMKGSLHYKGAALDVRTKNFPSVRAKRTFLQAVLTRLGSGYEGFLEHEGGVHEHIHIEWDPK